MTATIQSVYIPRILDITAYSGSLKPALCIIIQENHVYKIWLVSRDMCQSSIFKLLTNF